MMKRPHKPDESELLAFLDEELSPQRQAEIRQQLAADWELRANLAKLERRVEQFVDATAASQEADDQLPLDDWWRDFSQRLAVTAERPVWQARAATAWQSLFTKLSDWMQSEFRLRWMIGATACLFVLVAMGLVWWQVERPVSAQEFLQRTTQAETASLRRVGEPVVYRKIQIKRAGTNESVQWESWNDAGRKQFRQRIADRQGLRFLRANEPSMPALIAELEQILRANHFDPQHPLSPAAFAEWRKAIQAKAETVAAQGHELKLTTIAPPPYALNVITEAALVVRQSDWHAVALHLKVQSKDEMREYALSELAYEVLPLQALTVFADLPPISMPRLLPTIAPKDAPAGVAVASPVSTIAVTNVAALQAAEVEAMYALHQAQADLGEQLEVIREGSRQIVVRGLVQTATRKEELLQSLRRIPFVSPQIQTIEEAVRQAQRPAKPSADSETTIATNDSVVTSPPTAPVVNPFQQKLTEHLGGRMGMSEAEREEVNRQVSQFYNAVEADASAAMAEARALRRLQDRFASQPSTEFDTTSRQRLEEMQRNHVARLRQRTRTLQTRLRPLLIALAGEAPTVAQAAETTRPAQIMAVFRAIEQTSRLTDQLIAGNAAASLSQTARSLLTELARLDAVLTALEKN